MQLREEQSKFIEQAFKRLQNYDYSIYEMPTAFGKTYSSLKLAKKLIEEKEASRVFIVTSNNALARDIYLEAKKVEKEIPEFILGIGKGNYLSLNKLDRYFLETPEDEIFLVDKEEARKTYLDLEKEYGFVLIEDFLDRLNVLDVAKRDYVLNNMGLSVSNSEAFEDYPIQITNYAYIISKMFMNSNYKIDPKWVFIFDEVQDMLSAAELLWSNKFSIYGYYLQLKAVYDSLVNKQGVQKVLLTALKKEMQTAKTVSEAHKDEKRKNGFLNGGEALAKASIVYQKLFNTPTFKKLELRLRTLNRDKPGISAELSVLLYKTMDSIKTLTAQDVYMTFSEEKGYASFHNYSKDVKLKLALNVWDKIERFVGVTATALTSDDPHDLNAYERIGINLRDITLPSGIYLPSKNNKVSFIKTFEGVLSPEQADYDLNDEDYIEDENRRFEFFADRIAHGFDGKNTMVLVGGFDEVALLHEKLRKKVKNTNIICASQNSSVANVIKEFKEKGGILIGTRNYATGINLKGEALERLFLTKLPYPVYMSKKWIDLKEKHPGSFWKEYNTEMLITFRQAIGRLIRDPKDKGKLFILDGKYNGLPQGMKNKIKHFLDKVARELFFC